MTIMYVIIQEALSFPKELEATRAELRKSHALNLSREDWTDYYQFLFNLDWLILCRSQPRSYVGTMGI